MLNFYYERNYMQIYTSYFYQIRFFPPSLVPLSTAVWPPKYFGTPYTCHKDNRGVIIGLDIPPFKPGKSCENLCNGNCAIKAPNNCKFLKTYYQQLLQLNYEEIMEKFNNLAEKIKKKENLNDIDFALMVYETPTNLCSERAMIQRWFQIHDYPIIEWTSN